MQGVDVSTYVVQHAGLLPFVVEVDGLLGVANSDGEVIEQVPLGLADGFTLHLVVELRHLDGGHITRGHITRG